MLAPLERQKGPPMVVKPRWRARQQDSFGRTTLALGLTALAAALAAYAFAHSVL